jgi:L-alanine-DL-glutamate epimerase-like enolase superfamily enzyme
MARIDSIRAVLLSAPYSTPDSLEVITRLPTGWRTTGLVELALEDGTTGLGEGYLAVFAPKVFVEIVEVVAPYLIGRDADDISARYLDLSAATSYWSQQGAARHVVSAIEMALVDAAAKRRRVPAHTFLRRHVTRRLPLYASGGDSASPDAMAREIRSVRHLGLQMFKIRARRGDAARAAWTLDHAAADGIAVAVDMTQNLASPGQEPADAIAFLHDVEELTGRRIAFLEEPLGTAHVRQYPQLRARGACRIAGGETVTTAEELVQRCQAGWYDVVQPDATVVVGMHEALAVVDSARRANAAAVVHCWGSAVGLAANYHVALAGETELAEWPLPRNPLREELLVSPWVIEDGALVAPETDGLGVRLDADVETRYPFRHDAVYNCVGAVPEGSLTTAGWA